jgi:hypothetical protein
MLPAKQARTLLVETEGTHIGGIIGSDLEKNLIAQAPLGRTGVVRRYSSDRGVPGLGRFGLAYW